MTTPQAGSRSGTTLGEYRIEEMLGRGGMGEVYRAVDTRRGRTVALKLLNANLADNPAFRDRFMRESRVAATLNDPHVIPIHDWGEIDGHLFIDMRLVEGRDLRALIAEQGPMPADRALAIVGQIGDALDAAHRGGLMHRDVKPDNILVDDRDFAYLVDFGLAQADTDTRLTSTGAAVGSFGYMAPERFGDSPIGSPADIYALTCVLFECLSGTPPFGASSSIERLIAAHLSAEPPRLDQPIDTVIATGLAKDPAARFASGRELVSAARLALSGAGSIQTVLAPPPQTHSVDRQLSATDSWAATQHGSPQHISAPHTSPPGTGSYPATAAHSPASYSPAQPAPASQGAAPRRSAALPVLLGVVALLLVAAIVGGAFLLGGRSQSPSETANAADPTEATLTTENEPAPPEAVTETVTESAAAPAPPPAPVRTEGDLGLSTPITQPACDGTAIVVVGNAIDPANYAAEVQGILNAFPGSSYLRSDQSCPSLRPRSDQGTLIYAVYQVAGRSMGEMCSLRNRIGGDAYGKWLDRTTDPATYFTC